MSSVEISALTLRIPTTVGRRRGFVHAATDVDLRLAAGHVHALIGESGCGKSVVSSALVGLLPPGTRIAGRVLIDDLDLTPVLNRPRDRAWDAISASGLAFDVTYLSVPALAISSSYLRERVGAGQSLRYLTPDSVTGYLHKHALYGAKSSRYGQTEEVVA